MQEDEDTQQGPVWPGAEPSAPAGTHHSPPSPEEGADRTGELGSGAHDTNGAAPDPGWADSHYGSGAPESGFSSGGYAAPGAYWPPAGPPPGQPATAPAGRRLSRQLLVVAVVAALIGGAAGAGIYRAAGGGGSGQTVVEQYSPNSSVIAERPQDIQGILAKVLPAVVSIQATTRSSAGGGTFGTPFFGGPGLGSQFVQDEGSGMIITSGGEVVTNNHVIAGATTITVTLNGSNRALPAKLIGTDPADDVALLQIQNVSGLPTVSFGDSSKVLVGDGVVAIGNALGLSGGPSVTAGIISAANRQVTAGDSSGGSTETLTGLLQTDAAINPGNSGGPLANAAGQVIAMNTAVASNAGGDQSAQNIGFAIPSAKIQSLLPQLAKGGTVQMARAYMGVEVTDAAGQVQGANAPTNGALVTQVVTGSPAAAAGIQAGDVILSVGNNSIGSAQDLTGAVRSYKPGDKVKVSVWRSGNQLTLTMTLGTAPATSG
ncbi:MAG TPA: trypsin-like peptidase domain-containing protein [Acidimicrobiales bacterium]|nr:trypsin-like peptidase domain-containing protein [Acidimicrobiales bacterium]